MTPEHLQIVQRYLPRVLVSGPASEVARELNEIQSVLDAIDAELKGAETKAPDQDAPGEE